MTIERREFIQRASLSAAALSLPGWMQACSKEPAAPVSTVLDSPNRVPVTDREAFELARAFGRPLLVIVVPLGTQSEALQGSLFGVYLNNVEDDGLADLALCGVWCATPKSLRSEFGIEAPIGPNTLAVLIETDGSAPRVVEGIPPALPGAPSYFENPDEPTYEDAVRERNRWLALQLHAVIAPDAVALARRVEANRSALSTAQWNSLGGPLDERTPPTRDLAMYAPAWVLQRAGSASGDDALAFRRLLAVQSIDRLRTKPPPRTYWASSMGCGMTVEGQREMSVAYPCGMGYSPAISSRFLIFYAEVPR